MSSEVLLLLALGAGNGLMHALDADHVLAVSTVAAERQSGWRKILLTSLQWALGHGLSLVAVSLGVLLFGLTIPDQFAAFSEAAVGLMLIVIGVLVLRNFLVGRLRITAHSHGHMPKHIHLHAQQHAKTGRHTPVFIGLLHGVAGSAPLLALLPLVVREQFLLATAYVLLFTLSVALMMCFFGGLLGCLVGVVQARCVRGLNILQAGLGFLSMATGFVWLLCAI